MAQSGCNRGRGRSKRERGKNDGGWGGFREYIDTKRQKLQDQFIKDGKDEDSNIFSGVSIYVNGYTKPSSDELRRLMRCHGGVYKTYLSMTGVSHIVASNLPNSKFKLARTMPVVKPEWITDSVAAGKRLSHVHYLLFGNKSKLQSGLESFPSISTHSRTSSTSNIPEQHRGSTENLEHSLPCMPTVTTDTTVPATSLSEGPSDSKCTSEQRLFSGLRTVQFSGDGYSSHTSYDISSPTAAADSDDCRNNKRHKTGRPDWSGHSSGRFKCTNISLTKVQMISGRSDISHSVDNSAYHNINDEPSVHYNENAEDDIAYNADKDDTVKDDNESDNDDIMYSSNENIQGKVDSENVNNEDDIMYSSNEDIQGNVDGENVNNEDDIMYNSNEDIRGKVDSENVNNEGDIVYNSNEDIQGNVDHENINNEDDIVYNSNEDIRGKVDSENVNNEEDIVYNSNEDIRGKVNSETVNNEDDIVYNSNEDIQGNVDNENVNKDDIVYNSNEDIRGKVDSEIVNNEADIVYNSNEDIQGKVNCENVNNEDDIVYNSNEDIQGRVDTENVNNEDDIVYNSDENYDSDTIFHVTNSNAWNKQKPDIKKSRIYKIRKSGSGSLGSPRKRDCNSSDESTKLKQGILVTTNILNSINDNENISYFKDTFSSNTTSTASETLGPARDSLTEVCTADNVPSPLELRTKGMKEEVKQSGTHILCDRFVSSKALQSPQSLSSTEKKALMSVSKPTSIQRNSHIIEMSTTISVCTEAPVSTSRQCVMQESKPSKVSSSVKTSVSLESNKNDSSSPSKPVNSGQGTSTSSHRSVAKAGDKNFLSEFYSNSRLHHISTWGAEFKAYVAQIQKSGQGQASFPGRDKLFQVHVNNANKLGLGEVLVSTRHGKADQTIMHLDMDCFFVSVGLLSRPDLKSQPVAVTHSRGHGGQVNPGSDLSWERTEWAKKRDGKLKGSKSQSSVQEGGEETHGQTEEDTFVASGSTGAQAFHSMAEIASCSYEARKAGVKNGMFMGQAKQLCPNLHTVPYNFGEYNRVSRILYNVVASYTYDIEAVSCDEMFIDCTDLLTDTGATAAELAQLIRAEMVDKTGCTASAGIGPNILLARLATRTAKPNGQYQVMLSEAQNFIKDQAVSDLPGVGYSLSRKLSKLKVYTCGELQTIPVSVLRHEFGPKTGESLHRFSLGHDDRQVKGDKQRKSVSAEINYGIRFSKESELVVFLRELSQEIKQRLDGIEVKGRSITLKLMVRRPDAPTETSKFMGHGICNTVNRSSNLPVATNDADLIASEVISLYKSQKVRATDVRGIGIQINKLESSLPSSHKTWSVRGINLAQGHQSILSFAVAGHKSEDSCSTNLAPSKRSLTTVPSSVNGTSIVTSTVTISSGHPAGVRSELGGQKTVHGTCINDVSRILAGPSARLESEGPAVAGALWGDWNGLSLSQIDSQFLAELPPDIAQEVVENLELCKKRNLTRSTSSDETFKTPETSRSRLEEDVAGPSGLTILNGSSTLAVHNEKSDGIAGPSGLTTGHRSSDSTVTMDTYTRLAKVNDDVVGERSSRSLSTQHQGGNNGPRGETPTRREASLPSLSQLDLGCFHALPKNLQMELHAEYSKKKVTSERSAEKLAALEKENTKHSPLHGKKSTEAFKVPRGKSCRGRPPGKKRLTFGMAQVKSADPRKSKGKKKQNASRVPVDVVVIGHTDLNGFGQSVDAAGTAHPSRQQWQDSSSVRPFTCGQERLTPGHESGLVNKTMAREEVSICGATSLREVQQLLKEWLATSAEPQSDDICMVRGYLTSLVEHHNLEQVFCLLRFLKRKVQCDGSAKWRKDVADICLNVQDFVQAVYGATLKFL